MSDTRTTGATDAQIEAAHRRAWDEQRATAPYLVPFEELDEWSRHRRRFTDAAPYLVPPTHRIVAVMDLRIIAESPDVPAHIRRLAKSLIVEGVAG